MAALEARADDVRTMWMERSWDGGRADPQDLLELRTRAATLLDVVNGPYEDFCDALNEEPSAE